jgi:predicted O-methyltransferase YrrM
MLATVAYDSPDAAYVFSVQRSRQALSDVGIPTEYLLLSGNCHVDDARNHVVQEFLLTDCASLVFLDADVSWEPSALIDLCRHNADVVGGVYPFRRDDAESRLNMPVRMLPGVVEPDERGLIEVEGLPAGFMRISRHALATLVQHAPKYWNRNDRRSQMSVLFERTLSNGMRWGGDLAFCAKWRAMGGKVYAAFEMRLGHTAKTVLTDSLGAVLRRREGTTLRHMADKIRAGSESMELFGEARASQNNPYGATEDVLRLAAIMARKAKGPILEAGSGLTTVVMAAANPAQTVFCLEHDPMWFARLEQLADSAGVENIMACLCRIKDGWYDLSDPTLPLPKTFALGLNDGPPRTLGSRMGFFERFGDRCDVIVADDVDDAAYAEAVRSWANSHGRRFDVVGERAGLLRRVESLQEAAE